MQDAAGLGACPFDLNVDFTMPFDYNPSGGNLLVEYIITNKRSSGGLDVQAFDPPGGSVAQVFESTSNTATMGTFNYAGIITQFTFAPVPEPASWTMMAVAAALLWMRTRCRLAKRGEPALLAFPLTRLRKYSDQRP
jgi:hypothetical protein